MHTLSVYLLLTPGCFWCEATTKSMQSHLSFDLTKHQKPKSSLWTSTFRQNKETQIGFALPPKNILTKSHKGWLQILSTRFSTPVFTRHRNQGGERHHHPTTSLRSLPGHMPARKPRRSIADSSKCRDRAEFRKIPRTQESGLKMSPSCKKRPGTRSPEKT